MKKKLSFLALAAAMLLPLALNAQEELVVADGNATNFRFPFWSAYCDEGMKSEFIYPADMLEEMLGSTITSLEFYRDPNETSYPIATTWPGCTFTVKMECVNGVEYSSSTGSWQATSECVTVYTGGFTLANYTLQIELDEPFEYTGNDLLISISNNGGLQQSWFHEYWLGQSQDTYRGASRSGSSAPTSTTYTTNAEGQFLPKCKFSHSGSAGSICLKVQNLTVSGITGDEATVSFSPRDSHSSFELVVKTTAGAPDEDDEVISLGGDTSYTLNSLDATTQYYVYVRATCTDGGTSSWANTMFRTSCTTVEVPWTEGFEGSYTNDPDYSYQVAIPCWDFIHTSTSYSYTDISSTNHTGGHSMRFYPGSNYQVYAILPAMDNISGLELTLWVKAESSTSSGSLEIGYITNATDATTFVATSTIAGTGHTDNFVEETATFAGAPEGARIAIRQVSQTSNYYWWIDDLDVHVASDCIRPTVLVGDITTSTATVVIGSDASSFLIVEGENVYDISDTAYTLTDLASNTNYTIDVYAICAEGDTSAARQVTFRTACDAITTLPWTEGFEDSYTNDPTYTYQVMVPCWDFIHTSPSYSYTDISTTNHTGGHSMRFYPGNNYQVYAILPNFEDISGLEMTLWVKAESSTSSGDLEIGYITNPTDASTFVATLTIPGADHTSSFVEEEISFAGAPEGARIAIRQVSQASNYYWWVDDIDVHEAPACARPVATVDSLGSDAARIAINDANETGAYKVYIAGQDTIDVSGNTVTIDELQSTTAYTVQVWTVCEDGSLSSATSVSFTTECGAEAFPWSCPQSSLYAIGNANWNACWTYTSNVYRSTSNGILYVYTQAANTEFRLPPVEIPDYSQAQFRAMAACTTANAQFRLGFVEGENTVWFDTVDAVVTSSVTDAVEYVVPLGTYNGTGQRLVFGGIDDKKVFFQEFYIEPLDQCPMVSNLAVSDITESGATVSWTSNGEESTWAVYLGDSLAATVSTMSYELDNLTTSTSYTVGVRSVCGEGDTSRMATTNFRTPCGSISELPWTEDFEDWAVGSSAPFDPCWNSSQSSSGYPCISTSYISSNALQFYSLYSTNYIYATMPPVDTSIDISSLMLSFDTRKLYDYATTYSFVVGLTANPVYTTGMAIDTVAVVTTAAMDFEYQEVLFNTYTGNNRYIIFLLNGPNYVYIDNLELNYAPSCLRPASVSLTDLTANSVTVNINDPSQANNYRVSWGDGQSADITSDTYTITGLSGATAYTVSVATLCEDGGTSSAYTVSFRTPCDGNVNVPYTEGFESYSSSGNIMPDCWDHAGTGQAEVFSSYTHTGTRSLRFYPSSLTGNNIAVLPTFAEPLSNLQITLWSRPEDNSYSGYFSIGYITNPTDTSTFVATLTKNASEYSSNTYDQLTATFAAAPAGAQIALRYVPQASHTNYYWFIDDIEVGLADSTAAPTTYTVSATSADNTMGSATVTPSGTVNAGTSVSFTATANSGYHFTRWTNAAGTQVSTANPYTVSVTANLALTANFEANSGDVTYYTVSVTSADNTMGSATVTPSGSVAEGTSVTFTATAASGYVFDAWMNGSERVSTQNPYTVSVSSDLSLTATFRTSEGIANADAATFALFPNPATSTVTVEVGEAARLSVIDMSGRTVYNDEIRNSKFEISVSTLPRGTYFVRVSTATGTAVRKLIVE